MNHRDKQIYSKLEGELYMFEQTIRTLPGIESVVSRDVFIRQIIDSIHRIKSVTILNSRDISPIRIDPNNESFDPLKAAIYYKREGSIDEAFWLTFLATHFGKASKSGWQLVSRVYGELGNGNIWTWERTSSNPQQFVEWLAENYLPILSDGDVRFSNHRKFESLRPDSHRSTGKVVASYINWIGPTRSHTNLLSEGVSRVGENPRDMFHYLYKSMDKVLAFGRLGKFDFLTMLAKLELALIEPGLSYIAGASGPKSGASLMFHGSKKSNLSAAQLEKLVIELESQISVAPLGMQALEDSLCNWQKNPERYTRFSG